MQSRNMEAPFFSIRAIKFCNCLYGVDEKGSQNAY